MSEYRRGERTLSDDGDDESAKGCCVLVMSKLISMFDSISVTTWLHFGTQNPQKSIQKYIPRGIPKMIDFWIDFLPKLAPCWDPSWDPRAAPDGPKTPPRCSPYATKTAQEPQEHPRSKFGPFLVPKSDGVPPLASIFDVFSMFKFKFCCQICAGELGKFYIKF